MMCGMSGAPEHTAAIKLQRYFRRRCDGRGEIGPSPVRAGDSGNPVLTAILRSDEGWQVAANNCAVTSIAADPQGKVFYRIGDTQKISEAVSDGKDTHCTHQNGMSGDLAFGADGKLYFARAGGVLKSYPPVEPLRYRGWKSELSTYETSSCEIMVISMPRRKTKAARTNYR